MREQRAVEAIEHAIISPDWEKRWLSVNAAPFFDEKGQLYGAVASFRDITERIQAEVALKKYRDELERHVRERTRELEHTNEVLQKEIEEHHRLLDQLRIQTTALEAAANGIIITDHSGKILWSNPALTQMTGYTGEEMRGQNPRILRSGNHDRAFYKGL